MVLKLKNEMRFSKKIYILLAIFVMVVFVKSVIYEYPFSPLVKLSYGGLVLLLITERRRETFIGWLLYITILVYALFILFPDFYYKIHELLK
jgi:hypothetical protein